MDRRPFAGYPDSVILKRTRTEEDRKCATCGEVIVKGSLADTRDWSRWYCNEVCEKRSHAERKAAPDDIEGCF